MKTFRRAEIAAAAVCAATGLNPTPVDAAGAVTTSTFLPLSGPVINPGGGLCTEQVNLGGMLHVVSILVPQPPPIRQGVPSPPPIKLHFNMAGVMGTGLTTGNTYVATGAQEITLPQPPPIDQGFAIFTTPSPPPIDQGLTSFPNPPPIFQLEGTGDCAGQVQLPVNFNLIFDSSGHLQPSSSAFLVCQVSDQNNCQ